jgi:hypothetical protein
MFVGPKAMRSFLALTLLVSLCASASAATARHSWHHVFVHAGHHGWAYAAPTPPVAYNDTPSYDDPSKFGGGTALPATP